MNIPKALRRPLDDYVTLLYRWNRRIRLVGERDPAVFRRQHLGEVLASLDMLAPLDWELAVDIGSGNGLVAVPLALAFANRQVTALEPREKKCAFLRLVKHQLGLSNLEVSATRLEDYPTPVGMRKLWAARALEVAPPELLAALRPRAGDYLLLYSGELSPSARVVADGADVFDLMNRRTFTEDHRRITILARIRG